MKTISILAGGWSVRAIAADLARLPGQVIAINEAAVLAPRIDVALSMDRLWVENRWNALQVAARPTWLRRGTNRNCGGDWPGLVIYDCDHTAKTFAPRTAGFALNGPHSGFCALNLAWLMAKPGDRVVLFGFDHTRDPATGSPYWHAPYPWAKPGGATTGGKYQAWTRQYAAAAEAFSDAGVEVINASPASAVAEWPKADPRSMLV